MDDTIWDDGVDEEPPEGPHRHRLWLIVGLMLLTAAAGLTWRNWFDPGGDSQFQACTVLSSAGVARAGVPTGDVDVLVYN